MISYDEALQLINENINNPLPIVEVPIANSLNSICAENLLCDCYISPFDNSAMDGFAINFTDLQNEQTQFNVVGSSFAGDVASAGTGGAWEIMTGAPVPNGFNCVIKIEDVTILSRDETDRPLKIKLNVDPKTINLGNNIREAGQDFQPNDVIIEQGAKINAAHIAALATVGISKVKLYSRPKIAVMSTGKEIIDDAQQSLKSGQIRNSNGPSLMASLSQMNVDVIYAGTIADEVADYENCLKSHLATADIIISTGAVSMGRHDFIPDSLRKLGAEIIFHKVKIRPGKPVLFAKFAATKDKPNGTYYFGLPGNPISANVGLRFFTTPLINLLQAKTVEPATKAKLVNKTDKKHDFKMFYKAFARLENGNLLVDILQGQESFKIKPMLNSNCWAVFGENDHKIEKGELIDIYPLIQDKWEV